MKKSILKKLGGVILASVITLNIGTINVEAGTLKKNYNQGYYYSHGVSGAVSNNKNWMAFIDDNKTLSELSIPGTHDTMANYELTHIVRTQEMSLQGQLESGIRYIDIRCNYTNGKFNINHGIIGLKYDFDYVLNVVTNFLKENPKESIFMRIKQENSNKSDQEFNSKLREYVNKYYKYFWQNPTNITNPKLGDIRGKIVVFNDVGGSNIGLKYKSINIQDKYYLDTNWSLYSKWQAIKNQLYKAREGNNYTVYMNYLSGSGGSFPYFVASGQSSPEMSAPRLATGLAGPVFSKWYPDFPRGNVNDILFEGTNILTTRDIANNSGRVGIIAADFPGKGLIDTVISKNDFGTKDYISVGGVNYNGDKALEALRINFDYTNKYIYLTNRISESIHAGFGNNKFFKFRLLDKNNNEKVSIKLNGNDKPSDSKYNKLNFIKFEEGDIIEVCHEEPFRLRITGNKQTIKKQFYTITNNGLKIAEDFPGKGVIDTAISKNDYISVGGVNYNGDKALEALRINLDYSNKYIYLTNRISESIHAGFGNNKFFEFRLLDKNNNEKVSIKLNGNDKPSDSKYNKLNFIKFEEGDIIEVYHEEPFRLRITGNNQTIKKQLYIITNNGLKIK